MLKYIRKLLMGNSDKKEANRKAEIGVHFNESKGFIVVSYAIAKGIGYWQALYPAIGLDSNASIDELTSALGEAIRISKDKGEVDPKEYRDKNFWDISGIKGFSAFSKKYSAVSVSLSNEKIDVKKEVRDRQGAYEPSDQPEDMIRLSPDSEIKDIATAVMKLLDKACETTEENTRVIKTLGLSEVQYFYEDDALEDCGDGGTDAYQVYEEPGTGNYIAFLIDNGYTSFASENVRAVLERQYGKFEEYLSDAGTGRICVKAHNEKCRIETNIFYTKDDSIEVMYYTEGESGLITETYSKIIGSMKIQWAD